MALPPEIIEVFASVRLSMPDDKDLKLTDVLKGVAPAVPSALDLRMNQPIRELQFRRSESTMGHAFAYMQECVAMKSRGLNYRLSPTFVFDKRPDGESSMCMRDACKVLVEYGVPPEADYPYAEKGEDEGATREATQAGYLERAYKSAQAFKVDKYFRVNSAAEARVAMFLYGPVTCVLNARMFAETDFYPFAVCIDRYDAEGIFYGTNCLGETGMSAFVDWGGEVLEAWCCVQRPPPYPLLPVPGRALEKIEDADADDTASDGSVMANVLFFVALAALVGGVVYLIRRNRSE